MVTVSGTSAAVTRFKEQDPLKDTKTIQKGSKAIIQSFQKQDPFKQGMNDNKSSRLHLTETTSI